MKLTLKALRVNAGLNQAEAAQQLGIYIATLRNYEGGKTSPGALMVEKFCKVYNYSFDDINFLPRS